MMKGNIKILLYLFFGGLLWHITSPTALKAQTDEIQELKIKIRNEKQDSTRIDMMLSLMLRYLTLNPDSATYYAEKAFALSQKIGDTRRQADAKLQIGQSKLFAHKNKEARKDFDEALKLAEKSNHQLAKAHIFGSIGGIYYHEGNYDSAMKYFMQSLTTYEKINDKIGQARLSHNIGNLHLDQKNQTKALSYFKKALAIKKEIGDVHTIGNTYNSMGDAYSALKEYDKALDYYHQAMVLHEKNQSLRGLAVSYTNIGFLYKTQKKNKQALEFYEKALSIDQQLEDEEGIAINLMNIATLYREEKAYPQAQKNLEKALELLRKIGMKQFIAEGLKDLATLQAEMGNHQEAFNTLQAHIAVKDSVFSAEKSKQITEMQTLYETEKKDKQIAVQSLTIQNQRNIQYFLLVLAVLLIALALVLWSRFRFKVKTNRLLDEKNQELIRLNATKDKLFAIVAHDLKNPLSGFRSITQSLSDNVLSISKEEIDYFIKQLNSSANQLFDLLQNLLNWAIAQIGKLPFQPENLKLKPIITESLHLIAANATEKQINIEADIDEEISVWADKQMLRAILRNLLSNAIKFTDEQGRIVVSAQQKENLMEVSVADNGIGISENDLHKLFKVEEDVSSVGNSAEKGTGLGLLLCKELVEKQGGAMGLESELGKGSKFYFTLPLLPNHIVISSQIAV